MSDLVNKINKINKDKKNEPKELERLKKRIERNNEIAHFKREIERKISSIVHSIKRKRQQREDKRSFDASCLKSYEEYLKMATLADDKSGIETYETNFGTGTIIFSSQYGPFIKTPIANNEDVVEQTYLYEGFAKDESEFYNYYNLIIQKVKTPTNLKEPCMIIATGFLVNPKTGKIEKIEETLNQPIHFIESYYNLREKAALSIERDKK